MEDMMGTDNESPTSTGHEQKEILAELVNSTRVLEHTSRPEDIAIQVETDVTASLEKIAENGESMNFIPRVPKSLREGANGAYDPQVISIGPYHWGKPWLQAAEMHKRRFLADLLKRNPERGLRDYIKEIEALEPRLRSCYDKDMVHMMTSKDFLEMMLVDGCFLVEFSLQNRVLSPEEANPDETPLLLLMQHDIVVILENQLPFFLLQRIYDIATTNQNLACPCPCPSSFIQVALQFVHSGDYFTKEHISTPITFPYQLPNTIHHYLHLYHSVYLYEKRPNFEAPSSESSCPRMTWACMRVRLCQMVTFNIFATSVMEFDRRTTIPSATELHDLGIKFRRYKYRNHIKFHRGVMKMSSLYLSYRTSRIILNFITFERFDFEVEPRLIAYFKFMDLLVNTSNDVALLRRYGIISHQMGSDEEVALFFNQVTKGILKDRSPLSTQVYDKVNKYCRIRRHRWRASLIRDYCSSPWSTLGLVVGFILLALTFVQSYMSLHSYFRPPQS